MGKKEGSSKILKAGIGYTIGNIFLKCVNFLTLPIFSRIMTAEEFGAYNAFLSYDTIFSVFFSLALYMSLRSAKIDFKNEINEYISSISLIYILNLLVYGCIAIFFNKSLSSISGFSKLELLLLVFNSFGSSVVLLYNVYVSMEYAYKKYILVSWINTIGNATLSLVLIYTFFSQKKDLGRISGVAITIFIVAWGILISLYKKARPKVKKEYWRYAIKYSLPIVPHGVSQVLLGQVDRIMIRNMIGNEEVGIYSLAGNAKMILTVICDSISTVWSTWFYEKIEKKARLGIRQYAVLLGAFFTVLVVGVMAVSPELIDFLGGAAYTEGKYIVIPMLLETLIIFFYNIFIPSEYYAKKTTYVMYGTMMAATINIILNYLFIRIFGYFAAAYTTLFSYICYLVFHMIISYKLIDFLIIPLKWLISFYAIAVIMGVLDIYFMDNLLVRWLGCAAIVCPALVAIYIYWKKYIK